MSDARLVLSINGSDSEKFLQDLVTNSVAPSSGGLAYAALLTPQGKYLADFFLLKQQDGFLLDVSSLLADSLKTRLTMYKLRADVTIAESGLYVHRGTGEPPEDGYQDPRDPSMGWRAYRKTAQETDTTDWTARRIAACIPETGIELGPDSYILEMGFERLNGVDFRKGCYVGQEVTARMKHKTELRKGLARVGVSGPAQPGDQITLDGKPVGTLHSIQDGEALAYLRFDRATGTMQAGEATVTLLERNGPSAD